MKIFILSVIIIFVLFLVSLNAGERVKLFFKNGYEVSGEVIDTIPGDSIRFKPDELPEIVYRLSDISKIDPINVGFVRMLRFM